MQIQFSKYHGTGNDFILIDNRNNQFGFTDSSLVKRLCDRRFGIGADGLMLLGVINGFDFSMLYFNSDGKEGTMCGNGGRCITSFARKLGIITNGAKFMAVDGRHDSIFENNGDISLKMNDVDHIFEKDGHFESDTGSPHYVAFVNDLTNLDVRSEGRKIRYSPDFVSAGINVDFVKAGTNSIEMVTYERGVEDETLSCGTGSVAAVLCYAKIKNLDSGKIPVITKGGNLLVKFKNNQQGGFNDIWLTGSATFVYEGTINV